VSLQGFDPTGRTSSNSIITSSTPDPTGARVPLAGGIAKQSQFTVSGQKQLIEQYRKMSPAMRRALSQKLKDAGYRNPVTDKYNATVRQAFLDASSDLSAEITYLRTNDPAFLESNKIDLDTFLTTQASGRGGTEGGPSTTIQRKISTKLEAQTLIDEIYKDVLGRAPTQAEFDKYFKKLTKRQKDMPTKTTYSGGTTNVVTTTGGPDVQQYLYNQISGTDEAKARQVFSFYDVFKKALGVD
jgi:hypothetical protein